MTDRNVNDLNYGHLGFTLYNTDLKQWIFGRRPSAPLKGGFLILEDRLATRNQSDVKFNGPASNTVPSIAESEKRLLRKFPSLQPAAQFLTPLLKAHRPMPFEVHDPMQGELLSHGCIANINKNSHKHRVKVLAIPCGPNGSDIRISQVFKERRGWDLDSTIWLESSDLSQGDPGWWIGDGAPILQISFAQPLVDEPALLAARLHNAVVILRPIIKQQIVAPHGAQLGCRYPPSKIDANPISFLRVEENDGLPYVDVAFNPRHAYQFAVIDQDGAWGVFELQIQHGRQSAPLLPVGTGAVLAARHANSDNEDVHSGDEWHRVLWCDDADTLLVCNRQMLTICHIRGSHEPWECIDLRESRSLECILDVKHDSADPNYFFVLTTNRLIWYRCFSQDESDGEAEVMWKARMLLSWRHNRNTEDHSLRLSLAFQGSEYIVSVSSFVNNVVTIYRFNIYENLAPVFQSSADPIHVVIPERKDIETGRVSRIQCLTLKHLPIVEKEGPSSAQMGLGHTYKAENLQFYNLEVLYDDFSIGQLLLCDSRHTKTTVMCPYWSKVQPSQDGETLRAALNDFMVEDWMISETRPMNRRLPFRSVYSIDRQHALEHSTTATSLDRTIDQGIVYRAVSHTSSMKMDGSLPNTSNFVQIVQNWLQDMAEPKDRQAFTILDQFGSACWEDPDLASEQFGKLLVMKAGYDDTSQPQWMLKHLQPARQLGFGEDPASPISLSWLFDKITTSWINPLPPAISGRIRLRAEKTARTIATEVFLANLVSAEHLPEADESGLRTPTGLMAPTSPPPSSYFPDQQQLITPEATPSLISGSSFSLLSNDFGTSLARLQRFTTFDKHPKAALRDMDRFTAHWRIGVDPKDYDYNKAVAATANESNMSPHSRERLRRKAEKKLRQERRNARKAEQLQQSNQPRQLVLTHRSSPAPTRRNLPATSSQAPQSSQGASALPQLQSQVMPGPFGARQPPQKKRKVGTAGFR